MAYTTIDDPSAHFQVTTYTGNDTDGTQITNSGNSDLKPDWLWIKNRTDAGDAPATGGIWDSTRGFAQDKVLTSFTTNSEGQNANGFAIATTDGFTVEDGTSGANPRTATNKNAKNYVAWQWKANGGTTSSNSDGDITATVQANTTAGFSIVTFTGNGNNDATIGHGLGTTPAMIITKNRDDAVLWRVFHKDLTSTNTLFLNENFAQTAPSGHSNGYIKTVGSSTYSVYQGNSDTNGVNGSSDDMIAYCFAEKQGYSKIGSYTGNGNADGAFVYTGFKPAWLMIKRTDSTNHWLLFDIKRDTFNVGEKWLRADTSDAESTGIYWDGLSNGFKARTNDPIINASGGTYIYMTFAEHPFVSSKGVPVTAR